MDDRFGRAGAFLVAERETGQIVETLDNSSVDSSHGAGPGAAQMLKSAGVGAVIEAGEHDGVVVGDALLDAIAVDAVVAVFGAGLRLTALAAHAPGGGVAIRMVNRNSLS